MYLELARECEFTDSGLNISKLLSEKDKIWLQENTWSCSLGIKGIPRRVNYIGRAFWRYFKRNDIFILHELEGYFITITKEEYEEMKKVGLFKHYRI